MRLMHGGDLFAPFHFEARYICPICNNVICRPSARCLIASTAVLIRSSERPFIISTIPC